jgi:hypothetical protein
LSSFGRSVEQAHRHQLTGDSGAVVVVVVVAAAAVVAAWSSQSEIYTTSMISVCCIDKSPKLYTD